ncbi:MAG: PIN domain-containing protein [Spirochaetaceae bacterium]|nr:MAG: PIN domain-containing protein [Spirochaetaceae bacterium]
MNSLDTNILLYAVNRDCAEHGACKDLVDSALREPEVWIVAEQVWFELYRLLRNPAVLARPLGASQAADLVSWYRNSSGWMQCAWTPRLMKQLHTQWGQEQFPARRSFDLILAVTLKAHGVNTLYTRNTKNFADLDFFSVVDPLGEILDRRTKAQLE